ncbi:hypothetical protein Bca101_005035 [Brassica carinata]
MCIDTIRLPNRSMVRWLVARDTGLPSAAPLLRSYAKVETMTMAELNAFVVNAASQEIDFLRIGRFVRLDKDKGWCYAACSKCSKKLQRTASAFTCARCNNLHAVGALRFFTNDTGNTSAVSLLRGFSKVEPMKIAELNQFIITAQHQPIKFICTGKVTVSSQKKDGATSWTLEITCVGSVSLSAKMFGGGNEKENNSGSKTSTGLILTKSSDHNIC